APRIVNRRSCDAVVRPCRGEERQLQRLGRESARQFQGPLVLLVGLGVPAGRFGRQAGGQGGRQGLPGVAGSVEVPRHRGPLSRVAAAAADRGESPPSRAERIGASVDVSSWPPGDGGPPDNGGVSRPAARAAASSSSTKKGLPSERRQISSSSSGSGAPPRMEPSWAATSSLPR